MIQLKLFEPELIKSAYLTASNSPKKAYYKIWLEYYHGKYRVRKESGIDRKTLDQRLWKFETFEKAEKFFNKRIEQKTDPLRKSPRKYQFENIYLKGQEKQSKSRVKREAVRTDLM